MEVKGIPGKSSKLLLSPPIHQSTAMEAHYCHDDDDDLKREKKLKENQMKGMRKIKDLKQIICVD